MKIRDLVNAFEQESSAFETGCTTILQYLQEWPIPRVIIVDKTLSINPKQPTIRRLVCWRDDHLRSGTPIREMLTYGEQISILYYTKYNPLYGLIVRGTYWHNWNCRPHGGHWICPRRVMNSSRCIWSRTSYGLLVTKNPGIPAFSSTACSAGPWLSGRVRGLLSCLCVFLLHDSELKIPGITEADQFNFWRISTVLQ